MRVTNVIVTAFVAVGLFNGHYHHNGVGMVAAATLGGGGEEEAFDPATHGTMMTTVVDGIPAPNRKLLSKRSKASTPDANAENMERLVRSLVFATMLEMYHSMQPSSSEAPIADTNNNNGRRELEAAEDRYNKYACANCRAFFTWAQKINLHEMAFCVVVADASFLDQTYSTCLDIMACSYTDNSTPTTCCQSQGRCM